MTTKGKVLVTGATGKQGGAVARLLLERGHSVRALTRKPESPAAQAIAKQGAELIAGDMTDKAAMERASRGVDSVFLVCTPFGGGPAAETQQGVTVADAAKAAGAFLVYSSVANADRQTGIPHFESKFAVEKHIRATGADASILAPVAFMENLFFGKEQLAKGIYGAALPPTRKLAQIAIRDIAAVTVAMLEEPRRYAGKRYDIAGDELTGEDCVRILSAATGRPFRYFQVPLDAVRQRMGDDGVRMWTWLESAGYSIDWALAKRDFPGVVPTSFDAWVKGLPKDALS